MPEYLYRCPNNHRKEITHGIKEDPLVICRKCGDVMRRVPQRFTFGFNAEEIAAEWMDENYRRYRSKRMRFSPEKVKRPGKPLPATRWRK